MSNITPAKRPINTARAAEYLQAAKDGLTIKETAARLGVTKSTVAGRAWYYGIRFASVFRKREQYKTLAEMGYTARQAAIECGGDIHYARNLAKKHGFKFASGNGKRDYEMEARVRDMAEKGVLPKEISKITGFRLQSVYRILKRLEIKPPHDYRYDGEVRGLAESGMSKAEASRAIGISRISLDVIAKRLGVTFRDGRYRSKNPSK